MARRKKVTAAQQKDLDAFVAEQVNPMLGPVEAEHAEINVLPAAETTNVGGAQIENTAIEAARATAEERADTLVQEMHDDPKPVVEVAEPTIDELKARVAELEGQLAEKQTHILWTSKAPKPVALVREIFCSMYGSRRKDVIAACVNAGIAANTAKTQYQILKGKAERGELEELLEEGGESEE